MANERARFASSLALSLSNRSHLLVLSSSSCFAFLLRLAPSPSLFTQAKAALVYKTLLSQGKAIAKVTVGAVKDSICPAPLSSFELSLFSSAAFARAAAAAGWRALNQSTFLSVDPLLPSDSSSSAPSPSFSGDCVVARVLDDGATAAAPDALLVRCRVSTSRLRRPSFLEGGDDGGGGGGGIGEGEIDLFKVSASVRGKVACVLPTLEEVLLVDAVPRVEGDDVLVSAWEEAVGAGGNGESSSCSSSFSSSPFWLRAIPRIEVEDDCGDGEELSFATSDAELAPSGGGQQGGWRGQRRRRRRRQQLFDRRVPERAVFPSLLRPVGRAASCFRRDCEADSSAPRAAVRPAFFWCWSRKGCRRRAEQFRHVVLLGFVVVGRRGERSCCSSCSHCCCCCYCFICGISRGPQ